MDNPAMPDTKVFPSMWKQGGAPMLKRDLELAGISYVDDAGRYADFHSLRHCFGSLLAASGVHPKMAQDLMRHSDINLTMSRYTHTLRGQKAKAIEALPKIKNTEKQVKTGTADVPENLTVDLTENPINSQQNTVKYSKVADCEVSNPKNVTPCNNSDLQEIKPTRPGGLEPPTFGFEVRDSIQLSYGRFLKNPCFSVKIRAAIIIRVFYLSSFFWFFLVFRFGETKHFLL